MRPPARYSALELWLTRFELHMKELGIAEDQWTKELLNPLLEDEPFRVVTQLGLVCSTDYKAITTGNSLLQKETNWNGNTNCKAACRSRGKSLLSMQDTYMYSPIKYTLLRHHFIQGIHSQLHLMQEMLSSLDEALWLTVQKQSVELAQKRLHRKHSKVDSTFSLQAE